MMSTLHMLHKIFSTSTFTLSIHLKIIYICCIEKKKFILKVVDTNAICYNAIYEYDNIYRITYNNSLNIQHVWSLEHICTHNATPAYTTHHFIHYITCRLMKKSIHI